MKQLLKMEGKRLLVNVYVN